MNYYYFSHSSSQQQCLTFWLQSPYDIVSLHPTISSLLHFFTGVCTYHLSFISRTYFPQNFQCTLFAILHVFIYTPFVPNSHIHIFFCPSTFFSCFPEFILVYSYIFKGFSSSHVFSQWLKRILNIPS